ncbi:MAG: ferredoxin [Acidimicrobiia bacterium]
MTREPQRAEGMGDEIRISVDHNKCVGSRLCIQSAPGVFALNENGQSTVINVAGGTKHDIIEAAEQCPMEAITVEDAETGNILFP